MPMMLEIQASKCVSVMPENDIIVNRWLIYEWLKGNRIPENIIPLIETMSVSELREGCIEYLLAKQRSISVL